jgi:methionine-gamma-lyase
MPEEELERAGIRPGLVRLSIGYTGALEQRWSQLRSVLERMGLVSCDRTS